MDNIYICIYTLIYVSTLEDFHDYQVVSSDFHMLPRRSHWPHRKAPAGWAVPLVWRHSRTMGFDGIYNEKYWNIIRNTGKYRGIPSVYLT